MIDENYWEEEYYKFWDKFVKDWFDSGADPKDEDSREYIRILSDPKYGLNKDELPEPYQGNPKSGVDAVVLHLNPGTQQKGNYGKFSGESLEATKCYSNIDDEGNGWLIRKYRDEAGYSYKKLINEIKFTYTQNGEQRSTQGLSCLNPDLRHSEPEVCGVDWWQGSDPNSVGGTMKWVRQIYGNDQLCPSRVFAPEICPFHSKGFPTNKFKSLTAFIAEHVIIPTITAVNENKLPFAVALGASYNNVLETLMARKNGQIGVEKENDWSYAKSKFSKNAPCSIWPSDNGKYKTRNYRLYKVLSDGVKARILVTWTQGNLSAPADHFSDVEKVIRDYVRNNPL